MNTTIMYIGIQGIFKNSARPGAGQKLADGAQIIHGPVTGPFCALQGRQLIRAAVGVFGKLRLDMAADALQYTAAENLQQPVKTV